MLLLDRMRHAIRPTKDDLQRAKSRNVWFSFPVHAQKIFLCTLCNFVTDRLQKSCFIGLTVNVRSRCEQTAIRSHSLIIFIEPPFPFFFVFCFFKYWLYIWLKYWLQKTSMQWTETQNAEEKPQIKENIIHFVTNEGLNLRRLGS